LKNIIKIGVFILLVSLVSCGIAPIDSGIISEFNTNTTLKELQDKYDFHLEEDLVNRQTINGVKYTSFTLYRLTQYTADTYQNNNSFNQYGSSNHVANNMPVPTTTTRQHFTLTPFYLVFKDNNLYFMGYRYEAKSHPNYSQLTKIIGEEADELFYRK